MSLELFDTNVLMAVMLPHRAQHLAAKLAFVNSKKLSYAAICVHTLAEAYSNLSGKIAVPPQQARLLLQQNLQGVRVLPLEPNDYTLALERMASIGGGGVFDALLAEVALRNRCRTLWTINTKHFIRLGADVAKLVQEPQ